MLWRLYFEICDFLARLIPCKALRKRVREYELYDYKRKFNALRDALPRGEFRRVRIIKGGWNIGFVVDNKYVCKIRKQFDHDKQNEKILREKRITDAFGNIVPLKIPKIDIIESDGYTFYRYDFIAGKNLNKFSLKTIDKHAWTWAKQLAEFIDVMHNSDPQEIADLKNNDGDGWNHNDICNNIIVDKKSMNIVGIIDWEYAGWGKLQTELENCVRFSKKINASGIGVAIELEYHVMQKKKSGKKHK